MNSIEPISVSELTRAIKFNLESKFPFVQVKGEISNFKTQTSGHLYFNLKDQEAQIGAVMFRADAVQLKRPPKEGDQVILKGSINVYAPQGKYQLTVKELEYAGIGALLLKLEELKKKLHQMGYFKSDRKKPLPPFPKVIGVITSPTGAVIQDILNVLSRRNKGFSVLLNPVKVQGDGSAQEIAKAIQEMNRLSLCDVMIVGRGGGSIEDLWAFNEEVVANAIFMSRIPIISAVGHETDHTIADYVADVRAPTPSAAAEIVLKEGDQLVKHLDQMKGRVTDCLRNHLKHEMQKLNGIKRLPLFNTSTALLGPWHQRLDTIQEEIDRKELDRIKFLNYCLQGFKKQLENLKPTSQILFMKKRLIEISKRMDTSISHKVKNLEHKLFKINDILKAIDPKNLLNKGFTILFSEKGESVIKSIHSIKKNDKVRILLKDGTAKAIIEEII